MEQDILEYILNISRRMAETQDLTLLLNDVTSEAIRLTGAERGYVVLIQPDGALDFRVQRDQSGQMLKDAQDQVSRSVLQQVIESGQPLVLRDAGQSSRFGKAASVVILGLRSIMCVPLVSRGDTIGAIYVENRSIRGRFSQDDVIPLVLFANQVAVAIENARLFQTLQNAHDELETRVEERTLELSEANVLLKQEIAERERAEKALQEHADELQARNEDLDAFAHTVAHDIKSPLSHMVGYAQVLEEEYAALPEEKLGHYLHTIAQSGRKASSIVDELLLLASVREIEEIEAQPLDMGQIVAEVQERLARLIEMHQGDVILPERWPVALGYGPWVEEVWINYISNALKYGGHPPRVELGFDESANQRVGESASERDFGELSRAIGDDAVPSAVVVRFWVRDNGPGLTPEERGRLFRPHTRLDQVRAKGHGLGLSIVRRIVEKLRGEVGVESEVGVGSVFWFTLPASLDKAQK